jgi:hypothetical protein
MSKALTVKVPTAKVIKALETKLATVKKKKKQNLHLRLSIKQHIISG